MYIQAEHPTRLAPLAAKLEKARARAADIEADLKTIQRRADLAQDSIAALREEYYRERLRSWGTTPDVAALLASTGSMAFYQAGESLAQALGLGWGMAWADTNQTVLHLRLNRGDAGAIQRARHGVLYFAPFIRPKRGLVRFAVQHHAAADFAVELRYSLKTGGAQVAQLRFGSEDSFKSFGSLDAGLGHIQEHHWLEEFVDMPSVALPLPQ